MKKTIIIYTVTGAAVVAVCLFLMARINKVSDRNKEVTEGFVLYVGTYGEHLYRYIFDDSDNSFTPLESAEAHNPSYIALGEENSKDGLYDVYAVSESGDSSAVLSFADNIKISRTGSCDSIGADPCHVLFDWGGGVVLTADYTGGSVSVFGIDGHGAVSHRVQSLEFEGSGPVAGRQSSAHIHQLRMLPASDTVDSTCRYMLASDLGADRLRLLRVRKGLLSEELFSGCGYTEDRGGIWLEPLPGYDILCGEGSGPRHMEIDSMRGVLYCLTELSGEILAYRYASDSSGTPVFQLIQRIVADEAHAGGSADIHMHPSGKFLYTSHRLKNDGIAVFSVAEDGTLSRTGYTRTGKHPRNFVITPDGEKLLVACRDSKSIEVYDIDMQTGRLSYSGHRQKFNEDRPSCLVIAM